MEPRWSWYVCFCVSATLCQVLGNVIHANEHGAICGPQERLLFCGGCQKTCKDPSPDCAGVCRTGCYCNDDEVRNETGHCVKLKDCPSIAPAKLQFSEPRLTDSECPEDEEYRSCEPCNKTCDNPNPICPAQCARGCFCRGDLVRDKDGRCVKVEDCSNVVKNNVIANSTSPLEISLPLEAAPIPYQMTCGPHQEYIACRSCEKTCSSAIPVCTEGCNAGCYCQDGYLRAPDGQCVKKENCPEAEISYGVVGAQEPMIEDCSHDEIFLACGWCEPSCWDPKPECPLGVCTRGCLCRPPLLRHHSGHCVPEQSCAPQKCLDPSEEFVCRYGCEARCDNKKCWSRPQRCVLGCHCKPGLYRNDDGKCVSLSNCQSNAVKNSTHNKTANFSIVSASSFLSLPKFLTGIINVSPVSSEREEYENTKSVFGPIPETFDGLYGTTQKPIHLRDYKYNPESDDTPYRDAIARAAKIYKEFINIPPIVYKIPMDLKEPNSRNQC